MAGLVAAEARYTKCRPLDRLRHLAQLEFLDLAGARLRNFREHQVTWAFVRSQMLAAPLDQFVGARLCIGLQFDKGTGRLAPLVIRFRDYGGGCNGRVLLQSVFDLDRRDILSAGDDYVLGAVLELDVAVRMHHAEIASV